MRTQDPTDEMLRALVSMVLLACLACFLYGCSGPTSGGGGAPPPERALSAPGAPQRLWAKGRAGTSALDLARALAGVTDDYQLGDGSPEQVTTPELAKLGYALLDPGKADPEVLLRKLRTTKGIVSAGYEGSARVIDPVFGVEPGAQVTIDPLVGSQWAHAKLGSSYAWDAGYTGAGVLVGVLDTGVQCSHPDLHCRSAGKDFTGGGNATDDRFGHGTHVAGDCCERGSNGIGGSGIAPMADVLPVKVLGNDGSGSYSGIASGIVWAVDNGAQIINLSLGGPYPEPMMQDALRYGVARGVLFACAAGNDGSSTPSYPNAYPECIGVAATVKDGEGPASWSNWGANAQVGAPGESIMSSCITSRYCQMSGTSMASPVFAGVLALVLGSGVKSGEALAMVKQSGTALTGRLAGLRRPNIPSLVDAIRAKPTLTPPPTPTRAVPPSATPPKMTTITPPPTRTVRPGPTDTAGTPTQTLWKCSAIDTATGLLVNCDRVQP